MYCSTSASKVTAGDETDTVSLSVGKNVSASDERVVLVVDDEPSIRDAISEILQLDGYSVVTASNGAEALRIVDQGPPSLVLLDMRMPVLNGWDFARVLKERQVTLPIVVITAATDARAWAEEINAVDFLAKPFDLVDLLSTVERILPPTSQ